LVPSSDLVSIGDVVKHRLDEVRHEVEALPDHIKSIVRPSDPIEPHTVRRVA
jgi:hypothetical protein